MTFLSLNGEDFHVRVEGPDDAPVLMMSNSLATDLTMWDAQAAALKDRYRIVRYDSRGAGQSVAPDRPYSMPELARDALNILDALKIERAHWLGLSKGGMVGQWLAAHHGDRLGKVILANTAARMNAPGLWNQRIRTVRTGGMAAIVDATVARWLTPGCIAASPDLVARIRAMILATPAHGYAGCGAAIRDMDQHESIAAIRNPVLVIVGTHDPATPPATGDYIASRIPGARIVALDAAHLSNLEKPEAFTRAVADFLDA